MYNGLVKELLDKNGLKIGDFALIEFGNSKEIVKILPNSEFTEKDILVVKLESGYNFGISVDEIDSIEKAEHKEKSDDPSESELQSIELNKDLPRVSIIYTGGTIGSKLDYRTGGVHMLLKPEELIANVPELSNIAMLHPVHLFSIASEDMTYLEWQQIASTVVEEIKGGSRGVVITIGTDTMHYVSSALSFMLKGLNAPVVFTGSQRSSDRGSSDSFMNLICSVRIAAESDIAEVGICMHKDSSDDYCQLIRGTKARKMNTSRRDAFRPINDLPIAHLGIKGEIHYDSDYNKVKSSAEGITIMDKFSDKVALLKVYPNSDPDIINYYKNKGYKGIIIEGTGLGHTSVSGRPEKSYLNNIKEAIDSGMIIGMTSQCLYGRVNSKVYTNLRLLSNAGVVYCEDMTPETAYIKLGWLLGNYNRDEARRLLDKNIAGEIRDRTLYDEFLI